MNLYLLTKIDLCYKQVALIAAQNETSALSLIEFKPQEILYLGSADSKFNQPTIIDYNEGQDIG